MNRCPSCRGPLRFVGVKSTESHDHTGRAFYPPVWRTWERWDQSDSCGVYVVSDGHGNITGVTGETPRKGFFNGERA
jgi:hypothetical protein